MGTYYGSTAAQGLQNPPVQVFGPLARGNGTTLGFGGDGGMALWLYGSTNNDTDVAATSSAAPFITDAYYIGMRPGDILLGSYMSSLGSTTGLYTYRLQVAAVSTAGAMFSTAQFSSV